MFDPVKFRDDLLALESAILDPTLEGILSAVSLVVADVAEGVRLFTDPVAQNSMRASVAAGECTAIKDRVIAACAAPPKAQAAGPVGKLFPGDGSFLKNLALFIQTIWPLIAPFLSDQPTT